MIIMCQVQILNTVQENLGSHKTTHFATIQNSFIHPQKRRRDLAIYEKGA